MMPQRWILPFWKTTGVSQKMWRPARLQKCNGVSVSYVPIIELKGSWILFPEKEMVCVGQNVCFY